MNKAAYQLNVWLVVNQVSKPDFASRVGVKSWTLTRWLNGARLPSLKEAVKIKHATGGEIDEADWLAPCPSREQVLSDAAPF